MKIVQEEERRMIANILSVRSSNDPECYLGFPNLVGRRKKSSFQTLKDGFKHIYRPIQWLVFYYLSPYVLTWRVLLRISGGRRSWQVGYSLVCLEGSLHLKENGGLGFQNLGQFNVALLAKQGWRLVNFPNSLLARVLKAKYYPNSNFINAQLGNLPSLTGRVFGQ
ncbi:reverse transcriptase [Gossypium australe]|uniref:Reverse transcriptase n=1 Tax=Gossypium australe TaxID=47621 RepID=A0A5B6UU26_9ROSI|nr:reverse transcriptase [Gossypium australe]